MNGLQILQICLWTYLLSELNHDKNYTITYAWSEVDILFVILHILQFKEYRSLGEYLIVKDLRE